MQSKVSLPGMRPFTSMNYLSLRPTTHTAPLLSYATAQFGEYRRNSETQLYGWSWIQPTKIGFYDNVP